MAIRRIRTIAKAAEELKQQDPGTCIGQTWIRQRIHSGELRFIKQGNRQLVCLDDILELISSLAQAVPGGPDDDDIGPIKIRKIG